MIRVHGVVFVLSLVMGSPVGPFAVQTIQPRTFDQENTQQPPAGFSFGTMRQATPGRWTIERDGANGVLMHAGDATATGYALALSANPVRADVSVSARVRFVGTDRTAGLVWRASDDRNFHALVLDLAANTLAVYRVTAGNRIRLDVADDLELDPAAWHTLKVAHDEDGIRVSLGGIRVFRERDRRESPPGTSLRAGLLAGGASDVRFDDLRIDREERDRR